MPSESIYTFDDGEEAYIARDVKAIDDVIELHSVVLDGEEHTKPILAGPIHTQADANRLLPALTECKGVSRWIGALIEPHEEIDMKMWNPADPQSDGEWMASVEGVGVIGKIRPIDRVVVRGGVQPMHPDWVRSIRDQCDIAGVPFWFDGWGEWLPYDHVTTDEQRSEFSLATRRGEQSYFGAKITWGPQGPKTGTTPGVRSVSYARVGAKISGRTLNGREHRGEG